MRTGTYFEINVWRCYAEFTKENMRHLFVVVLACVNKTPIHLLVVSVAGRIMCVDRLDQRRHLHEVGARASYDK
jgi:hypothetical protein